MKKCKQCGDPINLAIFGMPDDVCWGCLEKDESEEILKKNLDGNEKKRIFKEKEKF